MTISREQGLGPRDRPASQRDAPGRLLAPLLALSSLAACLTLAAAPAAAQKNNVILFVGDGMGVSTVTATRIATVGLEGALTLDRLPYTAISRTGSADSIVPDSAATASAMMTGVATNNGVIGFGATTEPFDFRGDGDTARLTNIGELALSMGYAVGIVTNTRVTHATPAAVYAHVNDRGRENDIAAQLTPGGRGYNRKLGSGLHVIFGGGRRHFLPESATDEEGRAGRRIDGRDLRAELRQRGYRYVWNREGFDALGPSGRVVGLFESSHMEYEVDRAGDDGGEPSLEAMTRKAIEILSATGKPYFLLVESGRIDHAHHDTNAYRALTDTRMFDRAVKAARDTVDLRRTLILATADHSHVFTIGGYPLRPLEHLPYRPGAVPASFRGQPHHGLLGTVHVMTNRGNVIEHTDEDGIPYTILGYANGPGHRPGARVDPNSDNTPGWRGVTPTGAAHSHYLQETTVPLRQETHGAEDVVIYAIGATAENVRGTVRNTQIHEWIKAGFAGPADTPAPPDPDPEPPPAAGSCTPTTTALRFAGGYDVSMCWQAPNGAEGHARAGRWTSDQSGVLWFFEPDNAEVLIKVLDGCAANGHRWVFVAPATDLDFTLWVTGPDGNRWTHGNRQGETAATRSDTKAFPCDQ